ncbi:MAG: hypothetical protein ACRD7E_21545 [Bryobacteraceae bacterium]
MANYSETFPGQSPTTPTESTQRSVGERLSNAAQESRVKASELGRNAADKIDRNRESAAGALHNTASTLRNRGQSSGESITRIATRAADRLDTTATYMQDHSFRDMMDDVGQVVRRHPGPSIAAAAAVGFLLGAAMRRD